MSAPVKPFLLQSRIEDAILDFFRDLQDRGEYVEIQEATVKFDGFLHAYALACSIERSLEDMWSKP